MYTGSFQSHSITITFLGPWLSRSYIPHFVDIAFSASHLHFCTMSMQVHVQVISYLYVCVSSFSLFSSTFDSSTSICGCASHITRFPFCRISCDHEYVFWFVSFLLHLYHFEMSVCVFSLHDIHLYYFEIWLVFGLGLCSSLEVRCDAS